MRLFLVRHGESDANMQAITQGHMNSRLTERGLSQAKLVAERLKSESFDCVYVSDLDRARSTAREILRFHPCVRVNYSRLLRERDAGALEGRPKGIYMDEVMKHGFDKYRPEDGESMLDVQRRAVRFYEGLVDEHLGQDVLIVGHGGFFVALLLHLFGKPLDLDSFREVRPPNCSVTVLEVGDDRKHRVALLNCVKHIA